MAVVPVAVIRLEVLTSPVSLAEEVSAIFLRRSLVGKDSREAVSVASRAFLEVAEMPSQASQEEVAIVPTPVR